MCEQMNILNAQGYVHLKNFLDKENCAQLTNELKNYINNGKTTRDPQCPISQAVFNVPTFDSLLEQLLPNFEVASGKRLYPTYAYARLYAPGEELKSHLDRPSCEISATITLGFDPEGSVWPIYMGDSSEPGKGKKVNAEDHLKESCGWVVNDEEIKMEVGDAVLYHGNTKVHWRLPYKEGKWQAQVFLHYVDANGPHAQWKYDKRQRLSHHPSPEVLYWYFSDAMTKDAARKLMESLQEQNGIEQAKIGAGADGVVNKTIRDVKRLTIPSYRGVGATMAGMGMSANQQTWKFNVTHSNQTDYLRYDEEGHYHAHVDTFMNPSEPDCRKLTVLLFLNDDFEGGKLFLQNGHQKFYPPQDPGTCLVFPSFMLHGVEPVTKGVRHSIVTWLVGPWFK